ncbi:hypothetical protein IY145_01445 [Methylosinus sp. H3A]|uniref:hypothetical protein n=1 Tax=Methylosinus sp. H3A TaxID=2785786 RepID=UPI0018C3240F|nr:hypothetical protein [Methylosinus sp. H3A]MBG0808081.1 hypothetical protein [Methylosinus sp. H3A]
MQLTARVATTKVIAMPLSRRPIARPINQAARALRRRAANAGAEIALDARPKIVAPKKGKGSYRRVRQKPPDPE